MIEKEEITSTEFPEGGNATSTKGPPGIPTGEEGRMSSFFSRFVLVTIFYDLGEEGRMS